MINAEQQGMIDSEAGNPITPQQNNKSISQYFVHSLTLHQRGHKLIFVFKKERKAMH